MKKLALCMMLFGFAVAGCHSDDDGELLESVNCPMESGSLSFADTAPSRPPEHPCDYVLARKDGEKWIAHASASESPGDTIYVHAQGNDETLGFKLAFKGAGAYDLSADPQGKKFGQTAFYYTTVGGDVLISSYNLAQNTTLHIQHFDEDENVIEGTFEFAFVKDDGTSEFSFTQGKFRVHLPD